MAAAKKPPCRVPDRRFKNAWWKEAYLLSFGSLPQVMTIQLRSWGASSSWQTKCCFITTHQVRESFGIAVLCAQGCQECMGRVNMLGPHDCARQRHRPDNVGARCHLPAFYAGPPFLIRLLFRHAIAPWPCTYPSPLHKAAALVVAVGTMLLATATFARLLAGRGH